MSEEWVVYRVYGGYVDSAPAREWDEHMETLRTRRQYSNLTLLARGLTQEQAKTMKRLANEGEDDEI